jgi:Fic family protein
MNLKLEEEFSKAELLKDIDALKAQVDALRPLPPDVESRVMQKLRLDWNYHSNAIEGNRLNYGETVAFLMEGITAKGKPLKDHLDIRGHNEAINFLLEIVKDTRLISEADIRALHAMILVEPYDSPAKTAEGLPTTKRITLGEYKTSPNHVKTATGEIHYYATPEETPAKMQELMEWYTEAVNDKAINAVVIAALFHHEFVAIHPFDDGNGRLSRILMNLILMQAGYPPVVVKMDDRTNYYSLLSRADVGDSWPFVEYIAERLKDSLQLYLKAANGDDIDEDEDIDKRIALFKMELQTKILPSEKASIKEINNLILNVLVPFFELLIQKITVLEEIFETIGINIHIEFEKGNESINTSKLYLNKKDIYSDTRNALKSENKIKLIILTIELNGFKNPEISFDVNTQTEFHFDEQDYFITNASSDFEIIKLYNEKLSKSDKNLIIEEILKETKYWIEVRLSERK